MSGVIVYRSATGFTRQYALWLKEILGYEAVEYKKRRGIDWSRYDTIIYGGWFHAGGIRGLRWFHKKLPQLAGKRLAVFAVGASPREDPGVERALEANLSGTEWAGVGRFYLRGGLRYEEMGLVSRGMMACFRQMVKKKEGADSETYQGVSRSFDATDQGSLEGLIRWVKNE